MSIPVMLEDINDSYAEIAHPDNAYQWGPYNVHDPSIINDGVYFYSYSTDVAYGHSVRSGLQIRRSRDLVEWEFRGWVFGGMPPRGNAFIVSNGGQPFDGLWAPYVLKVGDEYRLYYSLSSPVPRLSVIGLAIASAPEGPWTEVDLVVTSLADASIQTNAIDPTVVVDNGGRHWMYYGSAWDGIYLLELDPTTGSTLNEGDKGVRVAQRAFTGNTINGNIEGPEIIYNSEFNKYYLFIAYDWLESKYNIRVGRSDQPQGPFYDIHGNNMNEEIDGQPMMVAPYRFQGHSGWQGTAHCAVFREGSDFYVAHQGRPASDRFFMIMHVRQLFWTVDGWPMASPERFADVDSPFISENDLPGTWERIFFEYTVVPGFADEQTSPDMQASEVMVLDEGGTINGNSADTWEYADPYLTLIWEGSGTETLYVHRGRDWENKVVSTLLFTGYNQNKSTVWGKKIAGN